MLIDKGFEFRLNISREFYEKKTDATACLSQTGAKAIGKEKMAFKEWDVTVDQFLWKAINGYTFCNLFAFDPNKLYWIEIGDGRHEYSYPVYQNGPNKGYMKLSFKRDQFFSGAQTVFVDIDLTRFVSILEYLACLTYPPTCVYMSYSDGQMKSGKTSRRFRMVYVFDHVLGKDDLNVVSRCITESIVRDTGEPMEDDCGERVSQYFNGVYGNDECYASYRIYYRSEFPESLPPVDESQYQTQAQDPTKPIVVFDPQLLQDMGTMDYETFMHYYSWKYKYFYRTESDDWIDGTYQLTDENYLQLWWPTEKITDGNHRRRRLFKRACLRRLMRPDVDPDTLLFNMYVDLCRFIDYSDYVITLDTLKRRTERAMQMDWDDLLEYCDYEIGYWRDNKPKCILHPDAHNKQCLIRSVTKEVNYSETDCLYDRTKSVKENAVTLEIPMRSLYRYCNERGIETNPGKGMTYAQQREANREARLEKKARFMMLYDPTLSLGQNRKKMMAEGLKLSKNTIRKWGKGYVTSDMLSHQPEHSDPLINNWNWELPSAQPTSSLSKFGWNNAEDFSNDPYYTIGEKIWSRLND